MPSFFRRRPPEEPSHRGKQFPQVAHETGLNIGYLYTEEDVVILLNALKNRDNLPKNYMTGDPNIPPDGSPAAAGILETGISTIKGRTIIETPPFSNLTLSQAGLLRAGERDRVLPDISNAITTQLRHLRTLEQEKATDVFPEKNLPENFYPAIILSPYNLGINHWNILEIRIDGPNGPAHCKRYNTDGYSYPVERYIFQELTNTLQESGINNVTNQVRNERHYPHSLQMHVNCGLASSIIMHDLKKGTNRDLATAQYDKNGSTNITRSTNDIALRRMAYDIVQTHGTLTDKNNFCKGYQSLTIGELNRLTAPNNATYIERVNVLSHQIAQIVLNEESPIGDQDIDRLIQASLAITSGANETALGQLRNITAENLKEILFEVDSYIKEGALDAVKQFIDQQYLMEVVGDPIPEIPDEFTIKSQILEDAINSLKEELKYCKESSQVIDYLDSLENSLSDKPELRVLFSAMAQEIIQDHFKKEKPGADDSPSPPKPADPTPPKPATPPAERIPALSKTEQDLLATYSKPRTLIPAPQALSKEVNVLNKESTKTPDKFGEFLRPRTYSGLGAKTKYSYNEAAKQFEFTVEEVFAGGLAADLRLQPGYKIVYQSDSNSNESLKEAVNSIRNLKNLRILDKDGRAIDDETIKSVITGKTNTLVHDKKVFDNSAEFIAAIQATADKIKAQTPVPEPRTPDAAGLKDTSRVASAGAAPPPS